MFSADVASSVVPFSEASVQQTADTHSGHSRTATCQENHSKLPTRQSQTTKKCIDNVPNIATSPKTGHVCAVPLPNSKLHTGSSMKTAQPAFFSGPHIDCPSSTHRFSHYRPFRSSFKHPSHFLHDHPHFTEHSSGGQNESAFRHTSSMFKTTICHVCASSRVAARTIWAACG
jgi:hypothetical protein